MFFCFNCLHPSLFLSFSSLHIVLIPSNDLRRYNYWVISTVITLNICSATKRKAFGCALQQLLYAHTVLQCRQIPPHPTPHHFPYFPWCLLSLCAISIGEMKWLLSEWEPYGGMICWCTDEEKQEDLKKGGRCFGLERSGVGGKLL